SDLLLPNEEDAETLSQRIILAIQDTRRLQPIIDRLGERLRSRTWDDMSADMLHLIEEHS
ncbi:MAG: hypothetical protein K8T89_19140, partial [Planctomycetes bacterium]|nr:hypothetical protein [Planctomycetota bacterium]